MTPSAFRKLITARRRALAVEVPGIDEPMSIRPLSDAEVTATRLAAQKYLETECRDASVQLRSAVDLDPELLERERLIQLVFRAYVTPTKDPDDEPEPAFESEGWVRSLDTVLVQALFDAYVEALKQRTVSPEVDDAALDKLVEILKRPDSEGALLYFSNVDLRRIARALALRLPA